MRTGDKPPAANRGLRPVPARSKAMRLPREVRERLDALLIERGFSDYAALADWLAEQGHPMSHAAVHRYGRKLERKVEAIRLATEQAKAIVAGAPDVEGAVSEATLRLAQERLFTLLNESDGGSLKEVAAAARAVADMARAGVSVAVERRKALAEAGERVNAAAKRSGLSRDVAAALRAAVEDL